jgi:hypothetical protein
VSSKPHTFSLIVTVIHAMPSQPQTIVQNNNHAAVYNRLDHKHSVQTTSSAIGGSYDCLDRTASLSDRLSFERSYSRLNCNKMAPSRSQSQHSTREKNISDSYDHLERTPSFNGSPSSADGRSKSFGSLEGQARFHLPSPTEEDSYNHLSRFRHASLPNRSSPKRQTDFYDKLDRSMASVRLGSDNSYDRLDSMQDQGSHDASSYDHLDNMQGSMLLDRDVGMSPPPVFSNVRM